MEIEMLTYANFRAMLALSLPEIEARILRQLDYSIKYGEPTPYAILGLVMVPYIIDGVEGRHNEPPNRLFEFLESAAASEDWELRNALGTDLIEGLVPSKYVMERCWPLMGPKTRAMAVTFAEALGYTANLPR
ncbi:MAG: DUF7674 family protein [Terriglobales bacterium]